MIGLGLGVFGAYLFGIGVGYLLWRKRFRALERERDLWEAECRGLLRHRLTTHAEIRSVLVRNDIPVVTLN